MEKNKIPSLDEDSIITSDLSKASGNSILTTLDLFSSYLFKIMHYVMPETIKNQSQVFSTIYDDNVSPFIDQYAKRNQEHKEEPFIVILLNDIDTDDSFSFNNRGGIDQYLPDGRAVGRIELQCEVYFYSTDVASIANMFEKFFFVRKLFKIMKDTEGFSYKLEFTNNTDGNFSTSKNISFFKNNFKITAPLLSKTSEEINKIEWILYQLNEIGDKSNKPKEEILIGKKKEESDSKNNIALEDFI